MRRTQLYLDEQVWQVLHTQAKSLNTTISDLVRETLRMRYLGDQQERMKVMQAFVGSHKESAKEKESTKLVRDLRRGSRIKRLHNR